MKDRFDSDRVMIDRDGDIYISSEFVDSIPTTPPDNPVRTRLFDDSLEFEKSACVIFCRAGKLFFALNYLNRLLSSSKNARPLRISLSVELDADGDQCFDLSLRDLDGNLIPAVESRSLQPHHLREENDGEGISGDLNRGSVERNNERRQASVRSMGSQTTQSLGPPPEAGIGKKQGSRASNEHHQNTGQRVQSTDSSNEERLTSTQSHTEQQHLGSPGPIQHSNAQSSNAGPDSFQRGTLDTPTSNHDQSGDDRDQDENTSESAISGARHSDLLTVQAQIALRTRLLQGMQIWEQLNNARMSDFDVLQAFLDERFPKALSVLEDAPNSLAPLATLPSGELYLIKFFASATWESERLGIPAPNVVDAICERDLRCIIKELYEKLIYLRDLESCDNEPSRKDTKFHASGEVVTQRHDERYINTILNRLSSQQYESLLLCKADIMKFIQHCISSYKQDQPEEEGSVADDTRHENAQSAETLACGIYDTIDHYQAGCRVIRRHMGHTRLIRRVEVPDHCIVNPQYPLPKYVLPLGRLCHMRNSTDEPIELEDILLVDVVSPKKALWRYRFLGEEKNRCYSLSMLAESIKDIGVSQDTQRVIGASHASGLDYMLRKIWTELPLMSDLSANHSRSCVQMEFLLTKFDRVDKKEFSHLIIPNSSRGAMQRHENRIQADERRRKRLRSG